MNEPTIFFKIISGEIPATKVYEDDTVLAFLDIQPIQPGHTLVIPKVASSDARTATLEDFTAVMRVAQRIAQAQTKILGCDGVNISMNCGEAAGQEVFHTHVHIIPRFQDDGVMPQPLRGNYQDDEATVIADRIANAIVT